MDSCKDTDYFSTQRQILDIVKCLSMSIFFFFALHYATRNWMETRRDYYSETDFSCGFYNRRARWLWKPQEMQEHVRNLSIMRAKGDIRDDFELRMSIPVRLIPRNSPAFARLHMNNYVTRPETFKLTLNYWHYCYRVVILWLWKCRGKS